MRKITKISKTSTQSLRRRRVAAYARVSCAKDAMLQSLSAQISYYNKLIQQRGDWEFVGVYADADTPYGQKPKNTFAGVLELLR